jgi:hypothetical protein
MRLQIAPTTTSKLGDSSHEGFLIVLDEVDDFDELRDMDWAEFKKESGAAGVLAFEQTVEVVR